jgi:hypothetical protein
LEPVETKHIIMGFATVEAVGGALAGIAVAEQEKACRGTPPMPCIAPGFIAACLGLVGVAVGLPAAAWAAGALAKSEKLKSFAIGAALPTLGGLLSCATEIAAYLLDGGSRIILPEALAEPTRWVALGKAV